MAIIAVLVGLAPAFPEGDEIYAYAIGVLVGTVVQLAICLCDLRNTPYGMRRALLAPFQGRLREALRDVDVRRVLLLMLPVTISLGLINFNLLINSTAGFLVSEQAPAAIDKAFRIYMLPQGVFSVAVATVLFPTLARFAARGDLDRLRSTMANGMRLILLLLIPATAAILVLAEPMIRVVYERGDFGPGATDLVSEALFWFAFSLPFNGIFLLLTRTFFSLQRPWVPTAIAGGNLAITAIAAFALYGPFGVGGIVAATAIATAVSVAAQAVVLRRALGRLELGRLAWTTVRVVARLGRPRRGQLRRLGAARRRARARAWPARSSRSGSALAAGAAVYAAAITLLRIPEAARIWALLRRGGGGDEAEPEAADERDEDRLEEDEELEEDEWLEEDDGEPLEDEPLDEEPFDETGEHPVDGPATVLVIESGDRAGEEFAIERPRTTIGRTPDADIFLDDLSVSREHAVVVRTDRRRLPRRPRLAQRHLRQPAPDRRAPARARRRDPDRPDHAPLPRALTQALLQANDV